jgi:hypothetical protein
MLAKFTQKLQNAYIKKSSQGWTTFFLLSLGQTMPTKTAKKAAPAGPFHCSKRGDLCQQRRLQLIGLGHCLFRTLAIGKTKNLGLQIPAIKKSTFSSQNLKVDLPE